MDHLIGGFDGLLPYAKEIERCGTSGQMFKALAYCNQRYINSLKLVRDRLEDTGAEIPAAPDELEDMEDETDTGSENEKLDPLSGKEKKRHGLGIFK